jgi:hypothetical protein
MAEAGVPGLRWQGGRQVGRVSFVSEGDVRYTEAMNLKAIIGLLLVLGLIVGGAGGAWGWKKWTASEERGVSLALTVALSPEQESENEEKYNLLMDDESILQPIVKEMSLISFYGVQTESQAIELLRKRSRVLFKDESTIWVVHRAERRERELNDRLGRMLGDVFVLHAFPSKAE